MLSGMTTELASITANVTADLATIMPYALGLMATLWGVRVAISYLKGIAQ